MTRQLLPIVGFGLLATLGLVLALVAAPERRELFLDVYLLVLGGIAVVRLVGLTGRRREAGEHSEFDDSLRPWAPEPVRIAELDKLDREVELGGQTAFDFHFRLRPTLVDIAQKRLAGRGIPLASDGRARQVLGDEAWELLRPDRDPPRDRNAPGVDADTLVRLVTVLERIS